MSRLTAAEARKIAGPSVDDHVDEALALIRKAAEKKRRRCDLHDDLWVNGGYQTSADYKAACKALTDLGYKVRFFYEEKQFVDMYTIVEW